MEEDSLRVEAQVAVAAEFSTHQLREQAYRSIWNCFFYCICGKGSQEEVLNYFVCFMGFFVCSLRRINCVGLELYIIVSTHVYMW